ncbi:MAG: RnfH family protein [Gammaproteobacteria bacterium]
MSPGPDIRIEVAGTVAPLAGPVGLRLPAGATLAEALDRLGVSADDARRAGIWGRRVAPDTPLRDGDRIECYRPLRADPKSARRTRVRPGD